MPGFYAPHVLRDILVLSGMFLWSTHGERNVRLDELKIVPPPEPPQTPPRPFSIKTPPRGFWVETWDQIASQVKKGEWQALVLNGTPVAMVGWSDLPDTSRGVSLYTMDAGMEGLEAMLITFARSRRLRIRWYQYGTSGDRDVAFGVRPDILPTDS